MSDLRAHSPVRATPARGSAAALAPDEAAALREACGWTREQAADALGVLPVEVQAWEAGTVPVEGDHLRWLAWHAENVGRDRALHRAGTSPCAWIVANREQLVRDAELGAAWRARDLLREHRGACAKCWSVQALTGQPPAVPGLTPLPGVRGWLDRMDNAIDPAPAWQRMLFRAARLAAAIVAFLLAVAAAGFIREGSWSLEIALFLPLFIVFAALGLVHEHVRPWDDAHPVLTGQARVAAVLVPGSILLELLTDAAPIAEMWWVVLGAVLLLGWVVGRNAGGPETEDAGS